MIEFVFYLNNKKILRIETILGEWKHRLTSGNKLEIEWRKKKETTRMLIICFAALKGFDGKYQRSIRAWTHILANGLRFNLALTEFETNRNFLSSMVKLNRPRVQQASRISTWYLVKISLTVNTVLLPPISVFHFDPVCGGTKPKRVWDDQSRGFVGSMGNDRTGKDGKRTKGMK